MKTFVIYSVLREFPTSAPDKFIYMDDVEEYNKMIQYKSENVLVTELARFDAPEGYKFSFDLLY